VTRKRLLERYATAEDGRIAVDVSVPGVEHLYNDFDRASPFVKKDLADEFADYLADSAREIGRHGFVIRINLERLPDETIMERVRRSTGNFFRYLAERERVARRKMFRTFALLASAGFFLLGLDLWLNRAFAGRSGVIGGVFLEGLTIAAWVAIWEALAILLVHWAAHNRDIRTYGRLANAAIEFRPAFTTVGGSSRQDAP
jgi:hypothetical protein